MPTGQRCIDMPLSKELVKSGWELETHNGWALKKKNWRVVYDTSSWIEVGTEKTPRVFDVPVPRDGMEWWTKNLIEHLCQCDDMLND